LADNLNHESGNNDWKQTTRPVKSKIKRNSRGALKLARIPHVNKKKKIEKERFCRSLVSSPKLTQNPFMHDVDGTAGKNSSSLAGVCLCVCFLLKSVFENFLFLFNF
jgi:hypothetical protein